MTAWTQDQIVTLRSVLANLYPLPEETRIVAREAGLNTGRISFQGSAILVWDNVLFEAANQAQLDAVLARALADFPRHEDLLKAQAHEPPSPIIDGPKPASWEGPETPDTLEKLMGYKSTLVPISYLEKGQLTARAVVRIVRQDGGSGTGFVADGNILVTNHHVLPSAGIAATAVVQFNYQQTVDGLNAPIAEFKLAPDVLFDSSEQDDWSVARIAGDPAATWGSLKLAARIPDVGEHVNIIQHPGGGPKQTSLFANVVVFADNTRVQYLTDTLPGSSGSPVFDADWNVIALHHSGGWITEPNAKSKSLFYRNEGIAIERVMARMTAAGE